MAEVTVLTEDQAKALPPDELLARYKELGSQEKALKKAREALKGEVLALIEGSGENSPKGKRLFKGASLKASLVQGQTTTYNVAAVLALCVKCGVSPSKVFSVGKKKADGAFVDNVPAMRALQDSATKVPSTPYPTISKVPVKKAAKPTKAAAKEPSDG